MTLSQAMAKNIAIKRERLTSLSERLERLRNLTQSLDKFRVQFEKECEEQGVKVCPPQR